MQRLRVAATCAEPFRIPKSGRLAHSERNPCSSSNVGFASAIATRKRSSSGQARPDLASRGKAKVPIRVNDFRPTSIPRNSTARNAHAAAVASRVPEDEDAVALGDEAVEIAHLDSEGVGTAAASAPRLRPYQEECIQECLYALKQGYSRIGVSSPTGSGKTTILCVLQIIFYGRLCL